MITFTAQGNVKLNGVKTNYRVIKDGKFYSIYWGVNPLNSFYSSTDKSEIVEHLNNIASLQCKPAPYAKRYYMPVA